MPVYNFKSIKVVPTSNDFVDIVLSKTQRQTPTVVHNGWAIQRIRQFYMRKVKYTQQSWHEKIAVILEDFPKVDDIHPFYADLMNVLYDKDHYKLALGQLNIAQKLIDKLAQDYVRLLKYGDSLYRCKQLKRAALVRQHLSRLPSIDPHTRTLLVCGYPNVGKSSFMNKVTRADVEVQPYAFTTKSLYIGHMDYRYLRWQVIDTPGVLDRPLEERNTIEMQSITALAHLRAAVLYVVDVSEECGYTLQQQAALFHSIKPLFANKPVMVLANKIDVRKMEDLSAEQRELLAEMERECLRLTAGGVGGGAGGGDGDGERALLTMSTLHEEGVMEVKQTACDRLLEHRVDAKMQGKRAADIANRVHVAMPAKRDGVSRPPCIPASVRAAQVQQVKAAEKKRTEKDMQEEMGGAGVYSADLQKHYLLEKEEWKYDIIPEIMDGHNILDFVDPDIDACLAELEQEEEQLEAEFQQELGDGMEEEELTAEEQATLARIKQRKAKIKAEHRIKKNKANNQAIAARVHDTQRTSTTANMRKSLEAMGYDSSRAVDRARARSKSREGRKRTRSADSATMDLDGEEPGTSAAPGGQPPAKKRIHSSRARTLSRGRSASLAEPSGKEGVKDAVQRNKAIRMADRAQKKRNLRAHAGESDRRIPTRMPKHLFSGKRGKGKTDRR